MPQLGKYTIRYAGAFVLFLLSQSPAVYADCIATGSTPSGGDIVNCSSPPDDTDGYTGTVSSDDITIQPAANVSVSANAALAGQGGSDTLTILGGTITSPVGVGNYGVRMTGGAADTATVVMSNGSINSQTALFVDGPSTDIRVSGGLLGAQDNTISVSSPLTSSSVLDVQGGRIESNASNAIAFIDTPVTISVSGGTIIGSDTGIVASAAPSNISVTRGDITGITGYGIAIGGQTEINISGGNVAGSVAGIILVGSTTNNISISGGTVTGSGGPLAFAIRAYDGNDTVDISGGTFNGNIDVGGGDDTFIISGGRVNGNVRGDDGSDRINLRGGLIGGSVDAGLGDDIVRLEDGVDITGTMYGADGYDTLFFAMAVPADDIIRVQAELAAANPAHDSIVINGLTYRWRTFEAIQVSLMVSSHAVPTMQEWALALLCGLILLCIFFSYRNRKPDTYGAGW